MTHLNIRSADGWHAIGFDALQRQNLNEAEGAFRQALLLDPAHANSLYRLGEFAQHRHDEHAAAYWYERALAAQPGHAGARKRLDALPPTPAEPPPKPFTPRQPLAPAGPPRAPEGTGVVGIVRNYQQHANQNMNRRSVFVIAFRVEVPGQEHTGAIPVEMRGPELHGSVANGDWVEMPERWAPGREPKQVRNLTTGQYVKFGGRGSHRHPLLRTAGWAFGIFVALLALAIIAVAIIGMSDPDSVEQFLNEHQGR